MSKQFLRLQQCVRTNLDAIILCTSINQENLWLIELCEKNGVFVENLKKKKKLQIQSEINSSHGV